MTIWTVLSIDDEAPYGPFTQICGSYTTREVAIDKCVRWVMDRFASQPAIAYAMANDENHKFVKQFFCEDKNGLTLIRRGMRTKLEEWLRNEIDVQEHYRFYDSQNKYCFIINKNDVEGDIWQSVTWGASNKEDPEFTAPYPEIFTSEETAVETFIDYVKDLYRSHHMKWSDEFLRETRKSLKENGEAKVDLNDGTCVGFVLYSGGANNVKE